MWRCMMSLSRVTMTTAAAVVAMLLLLPDISHVVDGVSGCSGAKMCCRHKDNTCRVQGLRMNRKNAGVASYLQSCFCDAGCVQLNDCCTDYREYCTVVDCQLSESWSDWGECSVLCGLGVKERHRRIVRHAQNGGRPCRAEDTNQRAVCEGITCKVPRALSPATLQLLREIGRIIPLSYARWRQSNTYNPFRGSHLDVNNRHQEIRTSCAHYELTSTRTPCTKSTVSWATRLKTGNEVCVECQSASDEGCRGRGVFNRETRWSAMTAHGCHGTWIMKTKWRHCSCSEADGKTSMPAFIFV